MGVSVLLVSWNARDLLVRCLASLASLPHEIVVVDNASADGSAERVARDFPRVKLVAESRNLGFAGAVNRARREASGTRLLLLNTDTEATPGAIDVLARVLDTPGIGAAAGRLVDPAGRPQTGFNIRRFPTVASVAVDLSGLDHLWPANPVSSRYYARDLSPDVPADVEQPAAACLMVRAALFDQLGGMDERFHPAWFEDVDFCRRLGAAGYRIRYEPGATFVHHGGTAKHQLGLAAFSRAYYSNLLRYFTKHHSRPQAALVELLVAGGMGLRALGSYRPWDRSAASAYLAVARDALAARRSPAER
jgi:N-acetylglucosaminyl-diphospho-decaprenol L-rhamnosyltransferase